MYLQYKADTTQEHFRIQWLLCRASCLAMRADQDYGTQGGRPESSAALPRGAERYSQLHSDYDCNEYVEKRKHRAKADDLQPPMTLLHPDSSRRAR